MTLEVLVISLAVLNLLVVLTFVRRRHLSESFAILWVGIGVFGLVIGLARPLIDRTADAIGVQYGTSLIFAFGIVFLLGLVLHLSVHVSRVENQCEVLATEIALMRGSLAAHDDRESEAPDDGPSSPSAGDVTGEP